MATLSSTMGDGWILLKKHAKRNRKLVNFIRSIRNKVYFSDLQIHERMLSDQVRIDAYYKAIKKYISERDTVVDLGTGTGILSFFAAQQRPKKIYSIDHSDIIDMAKHIAEQNSINDISFMKLHSKDFFIDGKVDVILHEQIGTAFLDEYMIPNICDLRDRLLARNGKIIPSKFDLFLEPICLKEGYSTPFIWERDLHGVRLGSLEGWIKSNQRMHDSLQISKQRRIMPCEVDYFLCEPEKIFSLDLYTAHPNSLSAHWNQRKSIVKSGQMDGFCLFFKIIFDDEISIDNSPFSKPTSWKCHLIRTESLRLNEGEILDVEWEINDLSNVHSWQPKYRRIMRDSPSSSVV